MSRISCGLPSPAKTRINCSLIASRVLSGSGASASVISRPAKHELRFANSAQDSLTGHGVRSLRNSGSLATRPSGGTYWRTAAHNSGVCANTAPSGWGEPSMFDRTIQTVSGRLRSSPMIAKKPSPARRGTSMTPTAVRTIRTDAAGNTARIAKSLLSPMVLTRSHDTTSPAATTEANAIVVNFSAHNALLRSITIKAITPAM